jgi:hypothetical protein
MCDHVRIHIFNQPISNQPTKYLGIKTDDMPELLSDWLIYLTVLHMIGWSKLNERLPDMTLNRILLDVINKLKKRYNKHVILIRLLPERSPTFECGLVSGCITTHSIFCIRLLNAGYLY